ncbi:Small integral membrane protein 15 [Microtus ochrogaster]|nr:Small integral membrane protein 15 [Microtus ochrogaster]
MKHLSFTFEIAPRLLAAIGKYLTGKTRHRNVQCADEESNLERLTRRLMSPSFLLATKMLDVKAWAEYVVEWAAKDPYGFLTTVILALTPLFLASAVLSWKLAKMIEAREKEQKKKQKRQENIAKAKRLKKD